MLNKSISGQKSMQKGRNSKYACKNLALAKEKACKFIKNQNLFALNVDVHC